VQYDLLKERSLMGVLRYDIIRTSGQFLFLSFQQGDATTDAQKGDLDAVTLAARYDLIETTRLALIIHGEYSHEKTKGTSVDGHDETDNRFSVVVDLML
jgi:predicted lipid-binding transport protein (Tim44 family)